MKKNNSFAALFIQEAIGLSQEKMSQGQGGPFGAVVVKEGKIISRGWNQVTSINDPTAHAEIVAIREACRILETFHLNGCEIYTNCEPCPMCLGAIYWARIKAVYYANTRHDAAGIGFDDEFIYREMAMPLSERTVKMTHLPSEEALFVFEKWAQKDNRIEY